MIRVEQSGSSAKSERIFAMKRYQRNDQPYYIFDQKDLDAAYAAHKDGSKKMNLWHVTCKGLDFSGKDLSGAALAHAYLQDCNFTGAKLDNVDFSRSNLKGSTIKDTEMNHCNLYGSRLPDATVENVKIDGTNLCYTDLSNAKWVRNVEVKNGRAMGMQMTEKQTKGLSFDKSVQDIPTQFVEPNFDKKQMEADLKAARSAAVEKPAAKTKAKKAQRA